MISQDLRIVSLKTPLPVPVKWFVIFLLLFMAFPLVMIIFFIRRILEVLNVDIPYLIADLINGLAQFILKILEATGLVEFAGEFVLRTMGNLHVFLEFGGELKFVLPIETYEIFLMVVSICIAVLCFASIAAICRRSSCARSLCIATLAFCIFLCVPAFFLGLLFRSFGGDMTFQNNLMGGSVFICVVCIGWILYFRHSSWGKPKS